MANDEPLYRVHTGDYIGRNFGKVINVYEVQTELTELLPNKEGYFTETTTQLPLTNE